MHFQARFPQHFRPVENPTPQDYFDASAWHYKREWRSRNLTYLSAYPCWLKSDRFAATYRRFGWIPKRRKIETAIEPERA
jgi:hypothetical protein